MSQEINDLTSFIQRQQQERNRREMMVAASAPDETKDAQAFSALNSPSDGRRPSVRRGSRRKSVRKSKTGGMKMVMAMKKKVRLPLCMGFTGS